MVALAILLRIVLVPYSGWVFARLWLWFIVPLGAPVLSVPMALGVCLTARILTIDFDPRKPPLTEEQWVQAAVVSALFPTFALGVGAIIRSFI